MARWLFSLALECMCCHDVAEFDDVGDTEFDDLYDPRLLLTSIHKRKKGTYEEMS